MEGITFHLSNLVNGYVEVARAVLGRGLKVAPRGSNTYELLGATIVVDCPRLTLPIGTGRNVSRAVAAMEALQLIGGFTDPVLTTKASSGFEKVKDGGAFHGAYGPRAAPQFPRVIERLRSDRHSRRAIVTIWDPAMDLYREGLHDYPCTVSLEYMIRGGKLVAMTHMRSNDVWLGLAYDAFVFTQVQLTLCNILDIEPGCYIHHASSLHLYDTDVQQVLALDHATTMPELPVGIYATTWAEAQETAQRYIYDPHAFSIGDWWRNALAKVHE